MKLAGVTIDVGDVEHLGRALICDHRRERHELGAVEPRIEQIVRLTPRRIGEDRAGAERAGPEFHAAGIDRADLARRQALRRRLEQIAGEPPHAGGGGEGSICLAAVVAAEVDVAQPPALAEPAADAVAPQQKR